MKYAPICIPTLNRYEHLKQCLESLSRCTWADKTEVYVALDYPPTAQWDKYAPGWEKNKQFLHSCGDMGFKKLHVIERTENYGIWLPNHKGNNACLLNDIKKKYDRFICTEDDNIFAPCFIEYMDKGLELFENDDAVLSIGGFLYNNPIKTDDNTFIRLDCECSVWGIGCWTAKENQMPMLDYHWYRKQLSPKKIFEVKKLFGWGAIYDWVIHLKYHKFSECATDNYLWSYLQLTQRQQIIPTKRLVHNIGLDGSGYDCTKNDAEGEWCDLVVNPLNESPHFEFTGTGYEYFEYNRTVYAKGKYWRKDSYYLRKIIKVVIQIILQKSAD